MLSSGMSSHYCGADGKNYFIGLRKFTTINSLLNIKKLKLYENNKKDLVVLDFGAGTGGILELLSPQRAIAIEVNPFAIETLEKLGIEVHRNISEISDELVDLIISNHSLEHSLDPLKILKECRRILRKDGTFVLCIPIDDWRTQKNYEHQDVHHHLFTWTPQLIGNCMNEAGFSESEFTIEIVTHAWPPGYQHLYKLPVFDFICWLYSLIRRRRQIIVRATKEYR